MFQIYNTYFSVVACVASGEKLKPANLTLVPEGVKPMISDQFVNLIRCYLKIGVTNFLD